jgi:probable HAF family extracellular repeat protein
MERISRIARRAALLLLCAAATAVGAEPARTWTIEALGAINNDSSTAEAINNRGDVAGWSSFFDPAVNGNRTHAILWQDGAMLDLGEGIAFDVNERGTVLGSVAGSNGIALYKDGAWHSIGLVGVPLALNRFDDVAGWYSFGGSARAFAFRNGVFVDIGTFGGASSAAVDINDRGRVVGYAAVAGDANNHAFLWENGRMQDLGTLAGGRESRAAAINNHGVVVGEAWDPNGAPIPFIYDGVMRPLFQAAGGAKAWAINDHGAVVGTMNSVQSFLWQDGTLTQLESIPAVRAAGWVQLIPTGINDRGWITGMGRTSEPVPPGHLPWKAFVLKPR